MNGQAQKFNDCYFYYYSSCNKGTRCPFRHSSAALGSENVCELWKDGKCTNLKCEYRHFDTSKGKKRETIACYWETQPTGCRKVHCPFSHSKPRPNDQSSNLILPLKAPEVIITPPVKPQTPNQLHPMNPTRSPALQRAPNQLHANTGVAAVTTPAEGDFHLAVKIDPTENSDEDSSPLKPEPVSSGPLSLQATKACMLKPRNIQDRIGPVNVKTNNMNNNNKNNPNPAGQNFGSIHIKTLDEIRRERGQSGSDTELNSAKDSGDSTKENKLHKRAREQPADNSTAGSPAAVVNSNTETLKPSTSSVSTVSAEDTAPATKKIKLDNTEGHLDFIDDILGSDIVTGNSTSETERKTVANDSKSNDWMKEDFPELFDI